MKTVVTTLAVVGVLVLCLVALFAFGLAAFYVGLAPLIVVGLLAAYASDCKTRREAELRTRRATLGY